jgi:hypothetical protein
MVLASVGVSAPRQAALLAQGIAVPPIIHVNAMVDTGATCTCIDPTILGRLGLSPTGSVPVHTPSTKGAPQLCDQYDVSLRLSATDPNNALVRTVLPVIASDLLIQGFEVLLGRDILSRCLLMYDGLNGLFSFAY